MYDVCIIGGGPAGMLVYFNKFTKDNSQSIIGNILKSQF